MFLADTDARYYHFEMPPLIFVSLLLIFVNIARTTTNKVDAANASPRTRGGIPLNEPDPLLLSYLSNLSNRDNLEKLEENIRRQRQIRFKSSYQELPKSLKRPLGICGGCDGGRGEGGGWGGIKTKAPADLSYFIQVDVDDDPPPSTALTTLPEGAKTYFPPQLSEAVVDALAKEISQQQEPKAVVKNTGTSEGSKLSLSQMDSSQSTFLLKASEREASSSYASLDQTEISNSANLPLTPSNSSNFVDFSKTSPVTQKKTSDPLFLVRDGLQTKGPSGPQITDTQELTKSSYSSYISESPTQSSVSVSSTRPFLPSTIQMPSRNHIQNKNSPSKPQVAKSLFPLPLITTLIPPVKGHPSQSFNSLTTPLPKRVSDAATSPQPSFVTARVTQSHLSIQKVTSPLPSSLNRQSTSLPSSLNRQSTSFPSSSNRQSTSLPSSLNTQSTSLPSSLNRQSTSLPSFLNRQSTSLPSSPNRKSTPLPSPFNRKLTTRIPFNRNKSFSKSQTPVTNRFTNSQTITNKPVTISKSAPPTRLRQSQSTSVPRFQITQSLELPSFSQNRFSNHGKPPSPVQNFLPVTKLPSNRSSFRKPNSKTLLNNSPKVFQANKDPLRRSNSGLAISSSAKDGKTRNPINSDKGKLNSRFSQGSSDNPTLQTIPKTGFQCASKEFGGYYADQEADCKVFHICWGRRSASFICPSGTLFNQQLLVCDWSYNVDCTASDTFAGSGGTFDHWGRNQV